MLSTKFRYVTSPSFGSQAPFLRYIYRLNRTVSFIDEGGIPILQWCCVKNRETISKGANHAKTIIGHFVDGFLY